MASPLFVGVDAGQTTVKAVVHDRLLRPVAIGRRTSPVHHPEPRFAERSQDELWRSAAEAIAEAVAQVDASRIAGVGISGHGDGLHLVDRDGAPASPAITAMDGRAFREWQGVVRDEERAGTILEVSGQQAPLGGAGPLLTWMREHGSVDDAAALVWCKDVLRLRLVGGAPETDLSDATASFLDMRTGEWSRQVLEAYGLGWAERLLPPLRLSTDIAGAVTAAASAETGLPEGTPVVVGLHDVQASAIGSAALVPGRLSLIAGSFSTNGVTTTGTASDPRWQCRVSIRPDLRVAMSTSPTASPALEWAVRVLGGSGDPAAARDALFAEAATLDPLDDTPAMLPFVLGSPLGDAPSATFAGLRAGHGRGHMFRGVLEGIAYMHVWHTRALASSYSWDEPIRLGGGISRAPLYAQMVADAMGQPVSVVRGDEVGAFGAAAVAAVGVGRFSSIDEAQELVELSDPVRSRPELRAHWEALITRFDELSDALTPWWERAG